MGRKLKKSQRTSKPGRYSSQGRTPNPNKKKELPASYYRHEDHCFMVPDIKGDSNISLGGGYWGQDCKTYVKLGQKVRRSDSAEYEFNRAGRRFIKISTKAGPDEPNGWTVKNEACKGDFSLKLDIDAQYVEDVRIRRIDLHPNLRHERGSRLDDKLPPVFRDLAASQRKNRWLQYSIKLRRHSDPMYATFYGIPTYNGWCPFVQPWIHLLICGHKNATKIEWITTKNMEGYAAERAEREKKIREGGLSYGTYPSRSPWGGDLRPTWKADLPESTPTVAGNMPDNPPKVNVDDWNLVPEIAVESKSDPESGGKTMHYNLAFRFKPGAPGPEEESAMVAETSQDAQDADSVEDDAESAIFAGTSQDAQDADSVEDSEEEL